MDLLDALIGRALLPLLDMAQHTVGGAELVTSIAKDVLGRTARPGLLREGVRMQMERLARPA